MEHGNTKNCSGGGQCGRPLLFASVLAILAIGGVCGGAAQAAGFEVIYSFRDLKGIYPSAPLLADGAGNFYGTARAGGTNGRGVVYKLSPPPPGRKVWTETVIHAFRGLADGGDPTSALIGDARGNLYGSTAGAGRYGYGVVFELSPPEPGKSAWVETALHGFSGSADGAYPGRTLTADSAGNLYGIGAAGGAYGQGVVFELSPPTGGATTWTEAVLYSFTGEGTAPCTPAGGVVADAAGNLYGVTQSGGAQGAGVVYELARPEPGKSDWILRVRHSFTGADGQDPTGQLVIDKVGNLYGTTLGGGAFNVGVVFELTPPPRNGHAWKPSVLHAFAGSDGALPTPDLLMDRTGNIYGTTQGGGASNSGVAFRLSPPEEEGAAWTDEVLKVFDATHGKYPFAGLTEDGAGNLYGTTLYGGSAGAGAAFEIKR